MKECKADLYDDFIKPDNYLFFAILSTFICFAPLGIVAILNAIKVSKLWNQKKYEQARIASDNALKFGQLALIVGGILWLIIIINY
ncbi:CD225/dispanin family protein [Flavobacterium agricola]|uniref:CD225/dispanin family protein n=1 Tax=Flavobacterium agricola TaxID=2870839 RepID=A0ABY6M1U1_9FLAO|nr:CD225/dispanin family protein [Flavobacterium agricola]UYW02539.1 CD225/dispanin family protein [Flavobacterium agricola]